MILGDLAGVEVDHRNGDGLDNRRCNLRLCTRAQNCQSMKIAPGKASLFRGVTWHAASNSWRARISLVGKRLHLGLFSEERAAAKAYDDAAKELHGEFAILNF
jgi:hypothetical protein